MDFTERFEHALSLQNDNCLKEALQQYGLLIEENPECKPAYINSGIIYSKLKMLDDALNSFDKALNISKDYLTLYNKGNVLYKKGEFKAAIFSLEQSKRLNNNFLNTHLLIGLSLSQLKKIAGAKTCFQKVIKFDQNNTIALTALAIIYIEENKNYEALNLIEQLLKTDQNNQDILKLKEDLLLKVNDIGQLSNFLKIRKKETETFILYDKFIKEIPTEIFTDKYGSLDYKIKELTQKNELPNNSPEDLLKLSLCNLLNGDTDLAVSQLLSLKDPFFSK